MAVCAFGHLDLFPFKIVGTLPEELGDGPMTEATHIGDFSKPRGMGPVNSMAIGAGRSPQIHVVE
jgi:hypothetical protein